MTARTLYTNSPRRKGDFALNFFMLNAGRTASAQLACPFFTTNEPLEILRKGGCRKIQLLVKLCGATSPVALAEARKMTDVHVRYFTSDAFHAKFYILGETAMLGSANLTDAGLKSNREIAIVIDSSDDVFDELPTLFDDLWDAAAVLTDAAMETFARWHKVKVGVAQSDVIDGLEPSSPVTVNVATQIKTRERTYLETFRRDYYETLLPAHAQVQAVYLATGQTHPSFQDLPIEYEVDRFLNWAKLTFTTDENLLSFPLLNADARNAHIADRQQVWLNTRIEIDRERTARLQRLKVIFASPQDLSSAEFSDLTDALLGCAAFDEQLRFTKGGKPALAKAFQQDNDLKRVKQTFEHLAFDRDDFVRRIYDCIFTSEYKLAHFGRTSVFELYGWINDDDVPPVNGRTIKALRYFGFDVRV